MPRAHWEVGMGQREHELRSVSSPEVERVVGQPGPCHAGPLLGAIAAQSAAADATRTIDRGVIAAIKASPLLGLAASTELGGGEGRISAMGDELAAIAGACASTAWCLWNHWSVFHLFCGAFGPEHRELLAGMVAGEEWVCFPAGAGSRVFGRIEGDHVVLDGSATFGSGSRYADWAGVAFALGDGTRPPTPDELRVTTARLDDPTVRIEATWDGTALRASATDTIHYRELRVPLERCTTWYGTNRAETLRDPQLAMIHPRYREDWVGVSDVWLAYMAIGVLHAALGDAVAEIAGRKAIMGATMANFVTVQANLGAVAAILTTARAAVEGVATDIDTRLGRGGGPDEADYQRQGAVSATALTMCQDAMMTLLRTLGGNGLRCHGSFERRWRDLAAMPIHINAHPDRIHTRLGQFLLGVEQQRF